MHDYAEIEKKTWDFIVIGTGIGGATIGHALAKGGKEVLFLEKGKSLEQNPDTIRGKYPPITNPRHASDEQNGCNILKNHGRYGEQIVDITKSRARNFVPFIGSGTGGSSSLYGMAMERFRPADFEPRRHHSQAPESSLPESWPISYETLLPYYNAAELLYGVHGERDPLFHAGLPPLPPRPALTAIGCDLFEHFRAKKLHPYQLPLACRFSKDCYCCQGFLCSRNCKNDANTSCLQPALSQFGATLIDDCEVIYLEADKTRINSVVCTKGRSRLQLRGKTVILAAGAIETPVLLLRSSSALWPHGLANGSGLVGRNLMRHYTDLYLVDTKAKDSDNRQKELGMNDFYLRGDYKLGTVQSFGRLPPTNVIEASLEDDLRYAGLSPFITILRLIKPVLRHTLRNMVERPAVIATIAEDLPYPANRVEIVKKSDNTVERRISYKIAAPEEARIARFRQEMALSLAPMRYKLLKQAENNRLLAHACGTCRAGHASSDSVLNSDNRAHEVENLYVIDSSFFPSSGGTNPSLTIAANALRVADKLLKIKN